MIGLRRMLAITSALSLAAFLFPASSASAATSLYYGSIRIILYYGASGTYSIPFGANISHPHMDNLPAGNIATVSGSAPAAIGLGANQITLHTSLFTTSPPMRLRPLKARIMICASKTLKPPHSGVPVPGA